MKRKTAVIAAFLVFLMGTAGAADKSDFAGTWKQNMDKSTTKSSWLKSYVNKLELKDDTLVVTTTTVGDRGERSYDRTYTLGKEERSKDRDGDEFTTTVKIDGRNLIFETLEKEGGQVLTSREVWTVSEDGKTMTKVIKRSGGSRADSEQQYFFEKQL
jgi:uncharacterized lipoprotein NlpE involved in copper resistance